jgi:hypothetical protein
MKAEIDQSFLHSRFYLDSKHMPPGYKCIPYHLVFDFKVDGRLKSRLVVGGHRTDPPKEDVFSGVVSMEAVQLGFLLARMNGLKVGVGDVGNAFLNARTHTKVFIVAGPEFGPNIEGKRLLVYKSRYGLKGPQGHIFTNTYPLSYGK